MKRLVLISIAVALVGCSTSKQNAEVASPGVKRYPMHGKILSVNAAEKSARIDAGPIGDYMSAMTMDYPIKDDAALAKLTPGTTIDATVVVDGDNVWVEQIKPVEAGAGK